MVACGGGKANADKAATSASAAAPAPQQAAGLSAEVTTSELVVGSNRFTMGVEDRQNVPIPDAAVHFRFFQLASTSPASRSVQATLRSEADGVFRAPARDAGLPLTETITRPDGTTRTVPSVDPNVGVYSATVVFDAPGSWAVEAMVRGKDAAHSGVARVPFTVLEQSATPAVGAPAPPSHNLTVKDVTDLTVIDTSAHPSPDMHTETVADALAAHHPTLVIFATPAYCQSRTCAPELEIVRKLEPAYQGKVDFIHIEIWQDPFKTYMPAVLEWHLPSEPWVFIIDRDGKISAKFEGPTTRDEIDAALQKVAS